MPSVKDRRRAQAGTTLVELLVSLMIISLALVLIVGTFSTGLLDATIAKRNTAVEAITQYEMDKVGASVYNAAASPYSECFATEDPTTPSAAGGYQGSCPAGPYTLRADVSWAPLPSAPAVQVWKVTIRALADGNAVGSPVSVYKANR
ncbi:MAG TPA: type II secretion system protein [Candidatus Dormibacteraeota bacterium]|jgi:type II secretory pathway pseudopilin PulG